jgi:uncharacterized membrane protein YkvA (DUF1232 family)
VLSPADLLPDVIPVLGLVDDVLLVSFMVSWIVSRLPQSSHQSARNPAFDDVGDGPVIDGAARRR